MDTASVVQALRNENALKMRFLRSKEYGERQPTAEGAKPHTEPETADGEESGNCQQQPGERFLKLPRFVGQRLRRQEEILSKLCL